MSAETAGFSPRYGRNFNSLVRLVCNVMDAFTVAYFRYIPEEEELRLFSHFSLGPNVVSDVSIRIGQGMIGWVAKERKPLSVSEFSHDATTLKLYSVPEEIKSFMAVPVMEGERLQGVLAVDSKRQYTFTPKHQKLMADFARVFSFVTTDQETNEQLEHEAASIETITSIVEEMAGSERLSHIVKVLHDNIARIIPNSGVLFALKSSQEGVFNLVEPSGADGGDLSRTPLQLDQSLLGWVIRNNRPINHHDIRKGGMGATGGEAARSFLGVPMVVRKEVVGALGLLDASESAFTQADLRILSILGSIAASYVAGSYAYGAALASRKQDLLTGLGNYIYLKEKVAEMGKKAPAGMMALDINDFSRITGDFSIDTADSALVEIAAFLKRVIGDRGHVARYYGDVFLVYLPGHGRDETCLAARKLLELIKAKSFFIDSKQVHFGGKIGTAQADTDGVGGGELIKRAFFALKSARKMGETLAEFNEGMRS